LRRPALATAVREVAGTTASCVLVERWELRVNHKSGLVVVPVAALALVLILVSLAAGCAGTPPSSGSAATASSNDPDRVLQQSIESQFKQDLGGTSFTLTQAALTRDANGNRHLVTKLQVPSVEVANVSIQEVMGWIEAKAATLSQDGQVRLVDLHVDIQTPTGEMVVDWTEDFAVGTATGHWAGGITNYWFPSPPPAESTTVTS
jgi:hypothetical protein